MRESVGASPDMVHVELSDDVESVVGEWRRLADTAGVDPFGRPEWFSAWAAGFGNGQGIHAVTARGGGDGRLIGLMPYVPRAGRLQYPANIQTPTASLPALSAQARAALVDALLEQRPSELLVPALRADDPAAATLRERADVHGYEVLEVTRDRSPVLGLDGVEDGLAPLSGKRRKGLRRCRRRLDERGAVVVDVVTVPDDLDATLDEAFAVEARQWKGARGTAIASDPGTERWMRALCRGAAGTGSLRLVRLRLDGRLVAFGIGFHGPGATYSLKCGFDPAFAEYSPGHLVTAAEIERALDDGAGRFEFLGGMEPYKLAWTDQVTELLTLSLVPRGLRGVPAWVSRRLVRRVRCRAARHPLTRRYVSWPFP